MVRLLTWGQRLENLPQRGDVFREVDALNFLLLLSELGLAKILTTEARQFQKVLSACSWRLTLPDDGLRK